MSSPAAAIVLTSSLLTLAIMVGFFVYVIRKYTPIIGRIFEEKPIFLPLRVSSVEGGEDVRFSTRDGLELGGVYLRARTPYRSGVVIFCHEYLSDRWSVVPYADHLRDEGFDLFSFDFRNHGSSGKDPVYKPLQWVTAHETADLEAAVSYLLSRPDADPAGFGLYGISRGGGTALCVAGRDPKAWGVVSDGAFPTRGTMISYMTRWAEIYVTTPWIRKCIPIWAYEVISFAARLRIQNRLGCRYENVERGVARLTPRPWLSIHGQKDAYIGVDIAKVLFERAGEPKEFWVVEGAKHNRCREKDPVAYRGKISSFFGRYGPRRPPLIATEATNSREPVGMMHELPIPADLTMAIPS